MRRVVAAAALRHQKMNLIARLSLRWMVRLRLWRERIGRWGRGSTAQAAAPAVEEPGEAPPA